MATSKLSNTTLLFTSDGSATRVSMSTTADNILLMDGLGANDVLIRGVDTPVSGTDAVNKDYVDALVTGLSWKDSCVVGTTVNGALATDFENNDVVNGVTLATGDRILLKAQSTGSENGIYIVNATGAPTRASDMAAGSGAAGAAVFLEEGTASADTAWVCTNNEGSDVVGTDALTFVQFSATGGGPAAPTSSIQYNNGGSFGGTSSITTNGTDMHFADNINLGFGNTIGAPDFTIDHEAGANTVFDNTNSLSNTVFRLGTDTQGTSFQVRNDSDVYQFAVLGDGTTNLPDSATFSLGSALTDFTMTHNGTNTVITNNTGSLTMSNAQTSGALNFASGTGATDSAGGEIDVTAGDGNGTGAGGLVDINAGAGGATGTGGAVTITSGAGGATSGAGGAVTITSGAGTAGNSAGGEIDLTAGAGQGTAAGGAIDINGGIAGATGVGGAVTIEAGAGGGTSGAGGAVTITSGTPTEGAGGDVSVTASAGVGTDQDGGDVTITAGVATGAGTDGQLNIIQNGETYLWPTDTPIVGEALVVQSLSPNVLHWSTASASAAGSNTQIQFNNSGVLGANANFTFDQTGAGTFGYGIENGTFIMQGLTATTGGATGASLAINGGTGAGTDGPGGSVTISSGTGGATDGDGGDLTLTATSGTGGGANGQLNLVQSGTTYEWPTTVGTAGQALIIQTAGATTTLEFGSAIAEAAGVTTDIQWNNSDLLAAATLSTFKFTDSATVPQMDVGVNDGTFTIQGVAATVDGDAGTDISIIGGNHATGTATAFAGAVTIQGGEGSTTNKIGGAINITGGNATLGNGAGGTITVSAGSGVGTSSSGQLSMSAGDQTSGAGNGGSVTINAGDGSTTDTSNGGDVTINTGSSNSSNADGGEFTLNCQAGTGTGTGGGIDLNAGASAGANAAGAVTIDAGAGGTTSAGGAITLTAGAGGATSGLGGAVNIVSGAGTAGNSAGGEIDLTAGAGQGSAAGGAIDINAGAAGATGTGGAVTITSGTATEGAGGDISVTSSAGAGTNQNGGDVTITAGVATGTGTDGQLRIVQNGETYLWPTDTPAVGEALVVASLSPNVLEWGDAGGVSWKERVIVATTTSGTLASDFEAGDTIDGYTLVLGDRILIKDQGTASENGIYTVNTTGAPTRAADLTTGDDASGIGVVVNRGTANGDTFWICTTDEGSAVVGTDTLAFAEIGAGANAAGAITDIQFNGGSGVFAAATDSTFQFNDSTTTPSMDVGVSNGTFTLQLPNGDATEAGGAITIDAGDGGATSGAGGAVSIVSGAATAGNSAGGEIDLTSGAGFGSAAGGALDLNAGTGGATGAGGAVTIDAGAGGATSGAGGAVTITSGSGTAGTSAGGALDLNSGAGNAAGAGGAVTVDSGAGGATGAGGDITVTAGVGGSTSGNGGSIQLVAGTVTSGTAGTITFTGGDASATSTGFVFEGSGLTDVVTIKTAAQNPTAAGQGTIIVAGGGTFTDEVYAVAFNATSDARLKTNISGISNPLDKLLKIEGYEYDWIHDQSQTPRRQIGVIAQQLEDVGLSQVVTGSGDQQKSVNYLGLIPLLIEGLKEMESKNQELRTKISEMENKIWGN